MFLKKVMNKNQELINVTVNLQREGEIPPNCFVIDLDVIKCNARQLAKEARKCNLKMYLMTKQFNRNPFVTAAALSEGFEGVVAVDFYGASVNKRFEMPVKHIGHLNQIPGNDIKKAVNLNPEVITAYSYIEAKRISDATGIIGKKQDILLRVVGKNDVFFYGQEGGILEEELEDIAKQIVKLKNINIVGVTSFPCLNYVLSKNEKVKPTNNLETIVDAAKILENKFDINITQINTPGNNFIEVFKVLSDAGSTHVEPGQALLGTTPSHAFEDLKGMPSYVYVSEISHIINGKGYAFGGGLTYGVLMEGNMEKALVGSSFDECMNNLVDIETESKKKEKQMIDYHEIIKQGNKCKIGDTVISSFYSQMQMTRAYIAPVSGIHSNKIKVEAIFDNGCHPLNNNYEEIGLDLVLERIRNLKDKLITN